MTALRSEKDLSAEFKEKSYESLRKSWQFMLLFFIIEAQMDSANSAVVVFDRRNRMLSIIREGAAFFGRRKYPVFLLTLAVFSGMVLQSAASARAGDLTGNGTANVVAGDSYNYVYGRRAQEGYAVANGSRVTVSGGTVSRDLYGGSALSHNGSAEAMNNSVVISGGLAGFDHNIYGGFAKSYTSGVRADGNSVTLGGALQFDPYVQVFGGYARMTGGTGVAEALDNRVNIGDSAVLNLAVGGEAYAERAAQASSLAANNTVGMTGGTVSVIYGGYAIAQGTAAAKNNTVNISGGLFGEVVGGEIHSYKGKAVAEGNTVIVTGGKSSADLNTGSEDSGTIIGASVQSDEGTAYALNNTVSVFNAAVAGNVSGAFAPKSDVEAVLIGNNVIVGRGATVAGDAVGGTVTGTTEGSRADFNIVTVVDGGRVDSDVIGGLVEAKNSSASGNTVLVRNASVGGDLYGGAGGAGSSIKHNSVIIGEGASFASDTGLYGGYVGGGPVAAAGSGNTLFVDSWQGPSSAWRVLRICISCFPRPELRWMFPCSP